MLEELRVRDVVLLKQGDLEFGPGLTVLTGETGAGKTALVSALKLLIGVRGDSTMVREGADSALVEGRFFADGEETLVRRSLTVEGRSRCYLNDAMVSVGVLNDTVGGWIDLSGQHDHQSLLRSGSHVEHLDRHIGQTAIDALVGYRLARETHLEAIRARDEVVDRVEQAKRDADAHRHAISEIEALEVKMGEYEELTSGLPALQHAEALASLVAEAHHALRGEGAGGDSIAQAADVVARAAELDPKLSDLSSQLRALSIGAEEIAMDLRGYMDDIDHEGSRLESVLQRLSGYDRLIRRYGPTVEDVLDRADRAREALALADDGTLAAAEAEHALAAAGAALETAAVALAKIRHAGATPFELAITEAIADLGMAGGSIRVGFDPVGGYPADGPEKVEFLYAPGPTATPRPLARIASGGELSRVMLALKGVLLDGHDSVRTLVFDEIDAGIGGATARSVAARIKSLASAYQVIVVTHLAQVAALADTHLLVSRAQSEDMSTTVRPVEGEERVVEIARMLSGSTDGVALDHARELLAGNVS